MVQPDSSMLADFVSDCNELLMCIEANILELERDRENARQDLIAELFRAMHSLKGNAGLMGFVEIRSLSHEAESLLSQYREGSRVATTEELELLLDCNDMLRNLVEHIGSPNQPSTTELVSALHTITQPPAASPVTQPKTQATKPQTASATTQPQSPQAPARATAPAAAKSPIPTSAKILVIDDDKSSVQILRTRFAKFGIDVDSAHDGSEAIMMVGRADYQVVITDIHMPGMTGPDLTMLIKRRSPFTQIVVLTADSKSNSIAKCMAYGACDFFLKDHGMGGLVSAIPAILERFNRWAEGPMRRELQVV